MERLHTKCLIIGSGPAGYTAAIYTSRANLNPLMYEGMQPGGQLTTTTEVENFPGYPEGVTGPMLMEDIRKQALRFGADIRQGMITEVDFSEYPLVATASDGTIIDADTVIISTGATAKYLGLSDEEKYNGMGVSACATCDGFFYRKKRVAVVGGGDTVRKDHLRASKVMQRRVLDKPNIKVLFNTVTEGLYGEEFLEGAHLVENLGKENEQRYDLAIDGFFLAIGHKPNTDIFKEYINLDEHGYIVTDGQTTATNVKGVFAAGDVADTRYRQAVTAAAGGCRAAIDAERFLMEQAEI